MLFNPLDQERFSVVSLLVSSPRVRVLSEDGQPLAVQISAHWSSATNTVTDVYQVSDGPGRGPQPSVLTRDPSLGPHSTRDTGLPPSCFLPRLGAGVLGRGVPEDSHSWDLSQEWKVLRKGRFGGVENQKWGLGCLAMCFLFHSFSVII